MGLLSISDILVLVRPVFGLVRIGALSVRDLLGLGPSFVVHQRTFLVTPPDLYHFFNRRFIFLLGVEL